MFLDEALSLVLGPVCGLFLVVVCLVILVTHRAWVPRWALGLGVALSVLVTFPVAYFWRLSPQAVDYADADQSVPARIAAPISTLSTISTVGVVVIIALALYGLIAGRRDMTAATTGVLEVSS